MEKEQLLVIFRNFVARLYSSYPIIPPDLVQTLNDIEDYLVALPPQPDLTAGEQGQQVATRKA